MGRGPSNGSVRRIALLFVLALPFGCADVLGLSPAEGHKTAENEPILRSPAGQAVAEPVAATPAITSDVAPPPPPPKSPYAYADTDPTDDLVPGPPDPRVDCEGDLKAAGIRYHAASLAVHTEGKKSKITCGAPEVVLYIGSPEKISYSSPPLLTCTMALALARFETVIQEEAVRDFGKRVKKIDHLGTYSCREMANYPGWVSEHSYANAIDLAVFTLEDGRVISVLKDFQKTTIDPTTRNALFLRTISHRAYDEDLFSNVLTEYFDKLHKSHFHLDMSRYRTDGTRPIVE
ncbi:MAG: extensin family protein [Polyangiaceae bacterium]